MMCKTNVSLNKSEGKDVPNLTGNSLSDNVGALTEVLEQFSEEKSSRFLTDGAAPVQMPSSPQATHLTTPRNRLRMESHHSFSLEFLAQVTRVWGIEGLTD